MPVSQEENTNKKRERIKPTPLEQHDGWVLAIKSEKRTMV